MRRDHPVTSHNDSGLNPGRAEAQSRGSHRVRARRKNMAAQAYSITRAEIEGFWRRKEMEEEEQRVATEKEAARIKAKALKVEDYMLFEQMIREILGDVLKGDMERRIGSVTTKNSTETRIGIKHWWRRSSYAYLNEPATTAAPTDDNGRSKHATAYIPQDRCMAFCSSIPTTLVVV